MLGGAELTHFRAPAPLPPPRPVAENKGVRAASASGPSLLGTFWESLQSRPLRCSRSRRLTDLIQVPTPTRNQVLGHLNFM